MGGQGLADLVVGSLDRVDLLLNRGGANFKDPVEVRAGREIIGLELADFDRDGRLDVAALNQDAPDHTVELLRNRGRGQLEAWRSVVLPTQPASRFGVADLNGDELPDLVVPFPSRQAIGVFLGSSVGIFHEPYLYAPDGVLAAVATGDFDGDGRLDVAGGDTAGAGLRVLRQAAQP